MITHRISCYADGTLEERINKWKFEEGLFQKDQAEVIVVYEMAIVNKREVGEIKHNRGAVRGLVP